MKKLICALLALMLLLGCAGLAEGAPGNGLGFAVLKAQFDGAENRVVSPYSLACALAMAARGAEGETKRQLLDALEIGDEAEMAALIQPLADVGLQQANAAFLAGEMVPEAEYIEALEAQFGAEWFSAEETSPERINEWVKESTNGLIDHLMDELPEEMQLMLINAIAMDADWRVPFDSDATYEETFHAPEGDMTVEMMHETLYADYGERDGVQLLRLDYADSELSLYLVLPEEGGVDAVLDGLCEEGMDYFRFDWDLPEVALSMPKTDITADAELKDVLQALGVTDAFGTNADFSGISRETQLNIGSVLQKARLILDEDGTQAAAVTAVTVETLAMPEDEPLPIEFCMDRPFVFAIADGETGAVCFAGIVANPIGN